MATSLVIPLSLSAKVIKRSTPVPVLGGKPFNRDAELEAGIHLHWALPDALTRARMLPDGKGDERTLFPGVPDLWLVVRFNPAPQTILPPGAQRDWRAWVVDSQTETAKPLASWTAPTNRDPKSIHTFAGMLPYADKLGAPGWGLFKTDPDAFNPAMAAYYPACRGRFGFHDDLADLGRNRTGNVSYTVVGWYSLHAYDPLFMSDDPQALLKAWKLAHQTLPHAFYELGAAVSLKLTKSAKAAKPAWLPPVQITEQPAPSATELHVLKQKAATGGSAASRKKQLDTMQAAFPVAEAARVVNDAVSKLGGPREIVCQGSVVEVRLSGPTLLPGAIKNEDVQLFPSVKRAMAEIASKQADAEQTDYVEMMLQDVDHLKGNLGGVLDYAGAVHALSFQSVPGASRYYARLDIHPPMQRAVKEKTFAIVNSTPKDGNLGSGHWPMLAKRSASMSVNDALATIPLAQTTAPKPPPAGPSQAAIDAWIAKVKAAFAKTATDALAKGTPIEPHLIHVHDYRAKAQPLQLGPSANGQGPDEAGWWLDLNGEAGDAALEQVLRSAGDATFHLPHVDNLYALPGPRWYRPWAPVIALYGTGRSFRFGFDGIFRDDGFLQCRFGSATTHALRVGELPAVTGREILAKPDGLAVTGLPAETRALVEEAVLLDTESAGFLAAAAHGSKPETFRNAVRGLWLGRDPRLSDKQRASLAAVLPLGEFPSPIGGAEWKDPRDPLFVDANYAHPFSSTIPDWKLEPDHVELVPNYPTSPNPATNPPAAQVKVFDERSYVTATVIKVLESALVTKIVLDETGHPVKAQKPPKGIDAQTFKKMDVLTAPLTAFDSMLFDEGMRQRAGALRINRLDLVDVFGLARTWNSGVQNPASPEGGPQLKWWTDLRPRLPFWARLRFRLQSAADASVEATPLDSPVCGILLPDFLEHAMEVFDGTGQAIGQLTGDRPRFGGSAGTLEVKFTVHPWVAVSGGDPLDAIANPTLRALVAAILAQSTVVPPNAPGAPWFETGLTALLRVIDTVRATLDPSVKTHDRKVRLLGEPILVLGARLHLEGTPTTNPSDLAKGQPPPLTTPPALPSVPVRIGDITRPDDGVLGCFLPGASAAAGRFAPVSKQAAEKAILNGLGENTTTGGVAVEHLFIKDQVAEFQMTAGEQRDLIILADARGGLYATCGILPRKKIVVPREFLEAALRHLEPTFFTGPIMTTRTGGALKAMAPPPNIEGHTAEFVHQEPDPEGGPDQFPETPVSPVAPVAELPVSRVLLTQGWLRLFKP